MALNLEQTRTTHKQRFERMKHLIESEARKLAEESLKVQYKNLSHFDKDFQEILIKEAEITFMNRIIMWLNNRKAG